MKQKISQTKKTTTKVTKKEGVDVTKKSAVKKVAKRSTLKTTSIPVVKLGHNKAVTKKTLRTAPDEKKFWLSNGEIIDSLANLADSFAKMDALIYRHHVNESKNDFALWVEQVLEDGKCAEALRRSKSPQSAQVVVVKHLKHYDL
jgi:hypothetical protein